MTNTADSPLAGTLLVNKTVVVTGAASGLGAAISIALTRQGAQVIALDRAAQPTDPTLIEAMINSAPISYQAMDVTDQAAWRLVADSCVHVDGLVNNAGTTWRARLADVKTVDADRVHAVNVTGPMLGIQALTPLMPRGGSIVNVGSFAGLTSHFPVAYTTSKWALRGLSRGGLNGIGTKRHQSQHHSPRVHRHINDRLGTQQLPKRQHRTNSARSCRHTV